MSSNKSVVAKKSVSRKTVAPKVVKPEPVVEEELVSEESPVVEDDTQRPDKRKAPTKELVLQSFDELVSSIEREMETLREGDSKNKGIKFLRTLNKRIKILKNQSSRIIKSKRNPTQRNTNNNSGFLKPVKISAEMAKFTGWDKDELRSRVDVTKHLCQYIRENNLQNPKDKRQILADSKLQKLLRYDPKKETEPLTYYKLQSQLKSHFVKDEVVA